MLLVPVVALRRQPAKYFRLNAGVKPLIGLISCDRTRVVSGMVDLMVVYCVSRR